MLLPTWQSSLSGLSRWLSYIFYKGDDRWESNKRANRDWNWRDGDKLNTWVAMLGPLNSPSDSCTSPFEPLLSSWVGVHLAITGVPPLSDCGRRHQTNVSQNGKFWNRKPNTEHVWGRLHRCAWRQSRFAGLTPSCRSTRYDAQK